MRIIRVPYHIDDFLPGLDVPLAPDLDVTADLTAAAAGAWDRMAVLYSAVSQQVADAVRDGAGLPVVQSGDCTTSLGIVAGLQRTGADPGVVWFDAHGDVQTLETTTSGYLGGLPLRLLAGYRPELIADRARAPCRAGAPDRAGRRPRPGSARGPATWPARRSAAARSPT